MILADLFAIAVMTALGALLATDTGPGRVVIYAVQRRRRQRRAQRSVGHAAIAAGTRRTIKTEAVAA